MADAEPPYYDVTVVGAGIAGLTIAAALHQQRLSVRVLERRADASTAAAGADVALWPGAMSLLKALGVEQTLFSKHCLPISTVHMCNMDFSRAGDRAASDVINTIDMDAVTSGCGEPFVLLARQPLMHALRCIVPKHVVVYGASDVNVVEKDELPTVETTYCVNDEHGKQLTTRVTSRIVIGADGARSAMRKLVAPEISDALKYCGEVCYRGVLELHKIDKQVRDKVEKLFIDKAQSHTMRICYGAGLRSSFGYMSADARMAYWWVKVMMEQAPDNDHKLTHCTWPEPLKTLHDVTPEDAFYMHRIEESAPLRKWSSPRVVLVGDAAHALSPNMGQGACMAVEDSVLLATLLKRYWDKSDGHIEAMYEYERVRRPVVEKVMSESRKQLFLGQLKWKPAVTIRNVLLRVVPAGVLQATLRASMFDVSAVREEFLRASAS